MSAPAAGPALSALPSGLRIVSEAMPGVRTASLAITIAAGSRDERAEEHGIAHFLEHMAFKGTRRRSARAIAEEIEAVGGDINAATSVETTTYTARVLAEDVPLAMDVLADILTDSVFDPSEIEREKDVVLQEIAAVEDTPDDIVFDHFTATAFAGQALSRPILGTRRTVKGLERAAISGFLDRAYAASGIVVSAAGAVDHQAIEAEASVRLARFGPAAGPARETARYTGGDFRKVRKLEQAHALVGFAAPSHLDPDFHAGQIFSNLLGGGMSSRLFQEVREKRGLAYSIYSFLWGYADAGLFGIYLGTGEKTLAEGLDVTLDCLRESVESVTEAEVQRARAQIKVALLMALESSSARADQLARQLLIFGRLIPTEESIARLDRIGVEDIRRVGRRMLATAPTVTALGPVRTLPEFDRIAGRVGPAAS
jgi:predicted Zn-dependent peptidase